MIRLKEISAQICVLGGGPAGYAAAVRAAQLGATVALVEKDELGGTCLNRGCIPTKALLHAAGVYRALTHMDESGLPPAEISAPAGLEGILARKDETVRTLRAGLEQLMKKNGVTVVRGAGTARSPHLVEVGVGAEGCAVRCEKLIVAAGSEPLRPPIPGMELAGVLTSDEALVDPRLPQSVVIVGGGVIGLEFASFYRSLGCTVTVIELLDRLLPTQDTEVSAAVLRMLKKQGMKFHLGTKVLRFEQAGEKLRTVAEKDGTTSVVESGIVLVAVGRRLCGGSAALAPLGLETERGSVCVDARMRTSAEDVYAAGDVTGGPLLAHLAFAQARIAAENAAGGSLTAGDLLVPACIYTSPEIASVGLSEQAAKEAGKDPLTGRFDLRANGRSLTLGNRDGFVKVVADRRTHKLLGACIVAPEASEMISELTLAIRLGATADVLADLIHPHPTLSEAIGEACGDALGRALHK